MKKKIFLVNNNMKIGGVQKALLEFVNVINCDYDITLLLFRKTGQLLEQLPENVKILETDSLYRYLGVFQGECKTPKDKLLRGGLAAIAKTCGISRTLKIMSLGSGDCLKEHYDAAISFMHCAGAKSFYGGVAEYTLTNIQADQKICFIHCDYVNSGTVSNHSKKVYRQYDKIACVSASVRHRFLEVLPDLSEKTFVVPNVINIQNVQSDARKDTYVYDHSYINILTVARLGKEKGINRIISAMSQIDSPRIRYYILGNGAQRPLLEQQVMQSGLEKQVFFLGEDVNPYRYMPDADLLAVPSYNEAAPVVFQEAMALGLPVMSTETLSAIEMIPEEFGFVVENTDEAIRKKIADFSEHPEQIDEKKKILRSCTYQNKDVKAALNDLLM